MGKPASTLANWKPASQCTIPACNYLKPLSQKTWHLGAARQVQVLAKADQGWIVSLQIFGCDKLAR